MWGLKGTQDKAHVSEKWKLKQRMNKLLVYTVKGDCFSMGTPSISGVYLDDLFLGDPHCEQLSHDPFARKIGTIKILQGFRETCCQKHCLTDEVSWRKQLPSLQEKTNRHLLERTWNIGTDHRKVCPHMYWTIASKKNLPRLGSLQKLRITLNYPQNDYLSNASHGCEGIIDLPNCSSPTASPWPDSFKMICKLDLRSSSLPSRLKGTRI